MSMTFEEQLGIIPLSEAIDFYFEKWPNDQVTKLQIEYEGPFLKYEFVGHDGKNRHTYEFNAQNKAVIKEREKLLSEKKSQPEYLEQKNLDLSGLLPLTEINRLALEAAPVDKAFQWELDRKRERTIWKVEIANDDASTVYEVKLDAQNGTITQIKLKS